MNPKKFLALISAFAFLSLPFSAYAEDNIYNGFEYEIREAQSCAAEGKLSSSMMTPAQSIAVMKIMDCVREQNGLKFPFENL